MISNDTQSVPPAPATQTPWLEVGDDAVLVRQATALESTFEGETTDQNRPGFLIVIDGVNNVTHVPYIQSFLFNRQEAYELFRELRQTFEQ